MFKTQYTEMWNNVDLIAERIRSLDAPAPGTYAQFTKLASIRETAGVPKAQEMIKILLAGTRRLPAPRARCSRRRKRPATSRPWTC